MKGTNQFKRTCSYNKKSVHYCFNYKCDQAEALLCNDCEC
jgi:hypothetical protein